MFVKVEQMKTDKGNQAKNQYIIKSDEFEIFQSGRRTIAMKMGGIIYLDNYSEWQYPLSDYRAKFLGGLSYQDIRKGVEAKTIVVTSLNQK